MTMTPKATAGATLLVLAALLAGCAQLPAGFEPDPNFEVPSVLSPSSGRTRVWVSDRAAAGADALAQRAVGELAEHVRRQIEVEGRTELLLRPPEGEPFVQVQPRVLRAQVEDQWIEGGTEAYKLVMTRKVGPSHTHTARVEGAVDLQVMPQGPLLASLPFKAEVVSTGEAQAPTPEQARQLLDQAVQQAVRSMRGAFPSAVVRETAQAVLLRGRVMARQVQPATGAALFQVALGKDDGLRHQDPVRFVRTELDTAGRPVERITGEGRVVQVLHADRAWVRVDDPSQARAIHGGDQARKVYPVQVGS
ncbi:hypothetical protein [Ideonella livida]|uniref:Lipoprotein n=1 Tax=Ideonella livida TaxID=2707176 RepID=A0A7C9PH00_9BURK|nr:hypothetical protein [Ideonella livida]NDY91676.1 hypothetical protein [Ideonella livida]